MPIQCYLIVIERSDFAHLTANNEVTFDNRKKPVGASALGRHPGASGASQAPYPVPTRLPSCFPQGMALQALVAPPVCIGTSLPVVWG
jgi:hypothetical protein